MKKVTVILMFIAIISKIFGFGRDITLSFYYGVSNISDAYLIALTIPNVIFGFVATGLSTGYIPMFSKVQEIKGELQGNRYTSNLINKIVIISTIIIIPGIIFAEQIVKIFAIGFQGETLAIAVRLSRISLFGIYAIGIISIFNGYLQTKGNYIVPALIGIPLNVVMVASIIISSKTDIVTLAIGSVFATIIQLMMLLFFARKKGYKHHLVLDTKDEHIKRMAYIALPIIISASVNQINMLVDRTIASNISIGGISALSYAHHINDFILGLFVTPIWTVMYPTVSKMAAKGDMNAFKKTIEESINSVSLLVIPASIGISIFAKPIVKLLFGRGVFKTQGVEMTAGVLSYYIIGMIGFALMRILSRGFYALQDTVTPAINAAIAVILNVILNIVLSHYMGLNGLALATSISGAFCTILLFISFRKKIGSFGFRNAVLSTIKILIVSSIMSVFAKLSYGFFLGHFNDSISLLISIGVGVVSYFVLICFANIREVDIMVKAARKRLARMT